MQIPMRKTLPFFCALVVISAVWNVNLAGAPELKSVFKPINVVKAAEIKKGRPKKLEIAAIGLKVNIVIVGADHDGRMSVPSDNKTVSWWKFGAIPGEMGSAVLAGHYKLEDGTPGVFYDLNRVKVGDLINMADEFGAKQKFKVREIKIFKVEDFPLNEVYANSGGKYLNLVTCAGNYLTKVKDYSHRLVIFTQKEN